MEEKHCEICGKGFKARRHFQKYCSSGCREDAEKRRSLKWYEEHKALKGLMVKRCIECGAEYETERRNQKYCSIKCRREANARIIRSEEVEKECVVCGRVFMTKKAGLEKTCSAECSYINRKRNRKRGKVEAVKRECAECGREYELYRNSQKYCSEECRSRAATRRKNERYKIKRQEKRYIGEEYVEIHRDVFRRLLREIFGIKRW